jgi:hypothetical protein
MTGCVDQSWKECALLNQVRTAVKQVVETLGPVAGIRVGTEEPPYTAQPLIDNVELRRYGTRIAAQTAVAAEEEAARNEGFRRLARYIFGANHARQKIAMTAPVGQQATTAGGRKIAMTAPVAQRREGDGGWVIRFFMPAKWTLDTLPAPDDERVELVAVPPETVAVLRFSGNRGPSAVAARTRKLREVLRATGFEPVSDATAWFYDPPWTLPFRRRNEIAIPVAE